MTAEDIASHVRTWLGVRFVHQGRSREGVDCAGLVICVGRELGFLPPDFDVNGYDKQPDGSMFRHCAERLTEAPPQVGGIFVMRFAKEPQHMGFFVPYRGGRLAMVHALQSSGKVIEHRFDSLWQSRIVGTFAAPGVT